MYHPHGTVARGDQPCTNDLSLSLKWAIGQRRENLFIGTPCTVCFPGHSFRSELLTKDLHEYRTHAVVQTNRNLKAFQDGMTDALNDRKACVHWVAGEDQDCNKLPFEVTLQTRLPLNDAYSKSRDEIKALSFSPGEVVFLSCGPLATIAAVYLFLQHPETTFIDIGSVWDPETRGVSHRCHKGTLPACSECN